MRWSTYAVGKLLIGSHGGGNGVGVAVAREPVYANLFLLHEALIRVVELRALAAFLLVGSWRR